MAYTFQFRDVFAQRDAILDGLVLTIELRAGVIVLGFVIGVRRDQRECHRSDDQPGRVHRRDRSRPLPEHSAIADRSGHIAGLTRTQVFRHVVLLPALKNVYPSLTSQFVLMMLATSVVSQISAAELFHAGSIIQSRTFRDFEVYTVIAVLYLCLSL